MPALHASDMQSLLLHLFIFKILYEDPYGKRNQTTTTCTEYIYALKNRQ